MKNIKHSEGVHAIITGDIVGSRRVKPEIWLTVLENVLKKYALRFDVFRGDSFQAELPIAYCFEFVFFLKAKLRELGEGLDVRMGIGIGALDYLDESIKSSNGEAFLFAGEAFDSLNKELLVVRSPWKEYDVPVNIMLGLTMELADRWTVNMAESVAMALAHPDMKQQDLAALLHRKHQSQVSTELRKAYFSRISEVMVYCKTELIKRC